MTVTLKAQWPTRVEDDYPDVGEAAAVGHLIMREHPDAWVTIDGEGVHMDFSQLREPAAVVENGSG